MRELPRGAARTASKAYRTTPLRAPWQHSPYFHDGSAATLADVVAHYNRVGQLGLTAKQQRDLVPAVCWLGSGTTAGDFSRQVKDEAAMRLIGVASLVFALALTCDTPGFGPEGAEARGMYRH
jgi:hypothetical protein